MFTFSKPKVAKVNFSAYDQIHEIVLIGFKSDKDIFDHCRSITETSIIHNIEWLSEYFLSSSIQNSIHRN